MILKNSVFYVLEINTLPGRTKNSLLPQQLAAVGISLDKFLEHVIKLRLQQHN